MKYLILLTLFALPIYAATTGCLEVRGAVFEPANRSAKKIYGHAIPDVEIQGNVFMHRFFNPWLNGNYVWKGGRSEGLHEKTNVQMGTLSVGSNVILSRCSKIQLYIGPGFSTAYLRTTDHSNYLPKHTTRWSLGAVAKGGLWIHCGDSVLLDLFFDYYYQPVRTSSSASEGEINMGGFRTGGGLGWKF